MARSQKVWVRASNYAASIVGTSVDTARVQGLRDTSSVLTAAGATTILDSEFTVVRFIGHWQVNVVDTTAGALVSNPGQFIFGGRVAGTEELEELTADAGFRAESGPLQDPMADWMFWNPAFAGDGSAVSGDSEAFVGKGMFDIHSARRVDGRREDFGVFAQCNISALTTSVQSFRLCWAALCVVH